MSDIASLKRYRLEAIAAYIYIYIYISMQLHAQHQYRCALMTMC